MLHYVRQEQLRKIDQALFWVGICSSVNAEHVLFSWEQAFAQPKLAHYSLSHIYKISNTRILSL